MSPSQSPSPQATADPRGERVAAAVRAWQRHLVDLGGRNALLWYRDLPSGTLDLTTAHPGGVAMLMAGRPTKLSDLVREPAALQEARRRARTIRAKAIELQEERGITAGFIAVGMATWRVAGASRAPAAPVLLRSCVLKATGAAQQDFALDLGADVELNPVLEHYLRSEQGLQVDADALADLSMVSKGFDPHPTFAALQRLCSGIPDFSISPRLVVGTFSYAKLPMVADLAAQGDALADHDVVAALAGDPDALKAVRSAIPAAATDPEPDREHLVLDADSSQEAVIEAVRAGANLVIKGPPGTGKSQTIANLIASLSGDGKRVLFVAEKRAAIDAVVGRLARRGPGRPRPRRPQRRDEPPAAGPGARRDPRAGQRRRGPRHHRGRADAGGTAHPPDRPRSGTARASRAVGGQRVRRPGRPHPADPAVQRPDLPGAHPRRGPAGGVPRPGPRARPRADRGRVPRRVDARPHATTPGTPPASPPRTRRPRRSRSPAG